MTRKSFFKAEFLISLLLILPLTETSAKNWWDKNKNEEVDTLLPRLEDESPQVEENSLAKEVARRKRSAKAAKTKLNQSELESEIQAIDEQAYQESPALKSQENEPLLNTPSPLLLSNESKVKEKEIGPIKGKTFKVPTRKISSFEGVEEIIPSLGLTQEKLQTKTKRKKYLKSENVTLFRVGILSGVSNASGQASSSGLLNVGLQTDLQLSYVGLELDGFYGLGLSSGTDSTSSPSNYGGFFTLKGNYHFRLGESTRFTPKLGVGYGFMSQSLTTTTSTNNTKNSTQGLYAMAGFDFILTKWFFISADFAKSVFADQEVEGSNIIKSGDPQFLRIRGSANFVVNELITVGIQYEQRTPPAPNTISERATGAATDTSQSFIMGHLGLQF